MGQNGGQAAFLMAISAGSAAALFRYVRKKSPRLILANIRERIMFDLANGIDTITQIPKEDFQGDIGNLTHGLHYSSSWTSEIVFGFDVCRNYLGKDFETYSFLDIGCGRGKVQIKWKQLLDRQRLEQGVYGLDYYDHLIDAAKHNYRKVFGRDGDFFCADATEFDYGILGQRLVVYLYNPFDDVILRAVLRQLEQLSVIVIYNNPEHENVLLESGYSLLVEKRGFHPQADTIVLVKDAT
jgi:SAM-dependent methyltransferase